MPRGSKNCKSCKAVNGPRAFACSSCGQPFVIKGQVVSAEKIEEVKQKKLGIVKPDVSRDPDTDKDGFYYELEQFFIPAQPDATELKNNGLKVKVWMSKDNKFRLRYSREFMGVAISQLHDKPYSLLKRNDERGSKVIWQLVRRFPRWTAATKYFHDISTGERELVLYRPGDDERKSRISKRLERRERKIKKASLKRKK